MSTNYKEKTEELYRAMSETSDEETKIQIRNRVVELNIRLVSQVLKKYRPYTDDAFQNGCLGLIQAAETYKRSRGVPFASFACFCIERAIHMAHRQQQRLIENQIEPSQWIRLDQPTKLANGDSIDNNDLIWDEKAQSDLESYIEENELAYVSENIIKPSIQDIVDRGKHMPTKVDTEKWKELEFAYIMDLVFIDSQKQRFNLSQLAKEVGLSVQNVKVRHERVMDEIFKRMWDYMTISFGEMLERLRGQSTIPKRLLCLDPGKTTGWCLFEDGKLAAVGQLDDCYDKNNVDVKTLLKLIEDVRPDFILYEDYKVYSSKLNMHTYNPVFTVRLIGAIEAHAQMHDIKTHKQMASTAKGFVTDDKLKQWGFWEKGKKHGRDAIRHGCYFLLFYKKGQNIV